MTPTSCVGRLCWRQGRKDGRKGLIVCGCTWLRTAKRTKISSYSPHVFSWFMSCSCEKRYQGFPPFPYHNRQEARPGLGMRLAVAIIAALYASCEEALQVNTWHSSLIQWLLSCPVCILLPNWNPITFCQCFSCQLGWKQRKCEMTPILCSALLSTYAYIFTGMSV